MLDVIRARDSGEADLALTLWMDARRERSEPTWFFAQQDVPALLARYSEAFPETAEEMLDRAAAFIETYGADVDWTLDGSDRLGRPHTPNTLRSLSRQREAEAIALSYFLRDRAPSNLAFLREHMADFATDVGSGNFEDANIAVFERYYAGHRTRNWEMVSQLLLNEPSWTTEDRVLAMKLALLNGARLMATNPRFSWGNHQLHGVAGLLETTVMMPEVPAAREWLEHARALILEHQKREIRADGFQFERASHYHKLDIVNYFRIYRLAALNDIDLGPDYAARFKQMFTAMVALATPDRSLPHLQDGQGPYRPQFVTQASGDSQQVASNDVAELQEPEFGRFMALGAALFGDPEFKYFATPELPAEFYWFLSDADRQEYASLPSVEPAAASVALPESGYFVMRSDWGPQGRYLLVDAGEELNKPDHSHGGVLGLMLASDGALTLPNYPVRYAEPSYRALKNSRAKSVALVDNILQGGQWESNKARTGFGVWRQLPTPTVSAWASGERFDWFSGSHDGFDEAEVGYSRSVLFMKPDYWVVVDEFESGEPRDYQQIWQGAYSVTGPNRVSQRQGSAGLDVVQADTDPMDIEAVDLFGYPSVVMQRRGRTSYRFETLLIPRSSDETSDLQPFSYQRPDFKEVKIIGDGVKDHLFTARAGRPIVVPGELESDGSMVAVRRVPTLLESVFVTSATYLTLPALTLRSDANSDFEIIRLPEGGWSIQSLREPATIQVVVEGQHYDLATEPGQVITFGRADS
jgi:hypothetical protein